ncbi:MAG: ABC transporter ATP-binding protein [Firmicutes bacterium]|nr:ABC transporter ATP-binding protein [Bacillota bacterium]
MCAPKVLLDVAGLQAGYASRQMPFVRAVDNISFRLYPQEIVGLAGESGCGKSSLLKTLYGLVEHPLRVEAGSIVFCGNGHQHSIIQDLRATQKLRWRYLSYIPQASMSVLNPVVRIEKQFQELMEIHEPGLSATGSQDKVTEYLDQLGLSSTVLRSFPHQLSGGMRQRVVIAMATLFSPALVLADEPTTGLDVVVQRGILQMVRDMCEQYGTTFMIVSHDVGIHYQITDRLMIMYGGYLVKIGTTRELFEKPCHPYTQLLIASLPRLGDTGKRSGIGGSPPDLSRPPQGCRFHPRCPQIMEVCRSEIPELLEITPGHYVGCHLSI